MSKISDLKELEKTTAFSNFRFNITLQPFLYPIPLTAKTKQMRFRLLKIYP